MRGRSHREWLAFRAGGKRQGFSRQHGRKVAEVMTSNPITIAEDTPLDEIVRLMERHNVKRFPVMRGDEIVGMVTRADFLTAIANASLDGYDVSDADERIRASVVEALSQAAWRPCRLNVSV